MANDIRDNAALLASRICASSGTQIFARAEVIKLLTSCYGAGRMKTRWDAASDPTRTEAKIGFLAIMCMETALPNGGEVIVSNEHGRWSVSAYGPKIRFDAPLWGVVAGKPYEDLTSGMVQFALLGDALRNTGKEPQIGHSDSAVSLKF